MDQLTPTIYVATFEDGREPGAEYSKWLEGYVAGLFELGEMMGVLQPDPRHDSLFHHPAEYQSIDRLAQEYPQLAGKIEDLSQEASRVHNIKLHAGQVDGGEVVELLEQNNIPYVIDSEAYSALREIERKSIVQQIGS